MPVEDTKRGNLIVPNSLEGSDADAFEGELEKALACLGPELILDCSQLSRAASNHIKLLWECHDRAQRAGKKLSLVAVPEGLQRVLQILDLAEFFLGPDQQSKEYARVSLPVQLDEFAETYIQQFRSDEDGCSRALDRFIRFLESLNIPEVTRFELRTTFYEVVTNVRIHGNLKSEDIILFTARPHNSGMTMIFADDGTPFDPTLRESDYSPMTAAKGSQQRGFGIVMIRKLVDRIDYIRKGGTTNVLTVEKNWE